VWVRWLQDISKFDPIFAGFTRYNLKFASLSKYNPGAHELFDLGGFLALFYGFQDFLLLLILQTM
jgi:hypothetical protein